MKAWVGGMRALVGGIRGTGTRRTRRTRRTRWNGQGSEQHRRI